MLHSKTHEGESMRSAGACAGKQVALRHNDQNNGRMPSLFVPGTSWPSQNITCMRKIADRNANPAATWLGLCLKAHLSSVSWVPLLCRDCDTPSRAMATCQTTCEVGSAQEHLQLSTSNLAKENLKKNEKQLLSLLHYSSPPASQGGANQRHYRIGPEQQTLWLANQVHFRAFQEHYIQQAGLAQGAEGAGRLEDWPQS
eukprot:1139599-Pelagomonas_calceolata.AAC.4